MALHQKHGSTDTTMLREGTETQNTSRGCCIDRSIVYGSARELGLSPAVWVPARGARRSPGSGSARPRGSGGGGAGRRPVLHPPPPSLRYAAAAPLQALDLVVHLG